MSEPDPMNLFDAVCRLDDLAEWLAMEGYAEASEQLREISSTLKGFIVLTLKMPEPES